MLLNVYEVYTVWDDGLDQWPCDRIVIAAKDKESALAMAYKYRECFDGDSEINLLAWGTDNCREGILVLE